MEIEVLAQVVTAVVASLFGLFRSIKSLINLFKK